jgi:hypothetical protein
MRTSTPLCIAGWMLLARAVAAQDVNYGSSPRPKALASRDAAINALFARAHGGQHGAHAMH